MTVIQCFPTHDTEFQELEDSRPPHHKPKELGRSKVLVDLVAAGLPKCDQFSCRFGMRMQDSDSVGLENRLRKSVLFGHLNLKPSTPHFPHARPRRSRTRATGSPSHCPGRSTASRRGARQTALAREVCVKLRKTGARSQAFQTKPHLRKTLSLSLDPKP